MTTTGHVHDADLEPAARVGRASLVIGGLACGSPLG